MIRVALVDDHVSFRGALAFMLERQEDLTVAVQASLLAEARTLLESVPVDVALVDLDLPDGNGLDLLRTLRERNPDAAAVILTGSTRPESKALAVANGAIGFLHKSVGTSEVANAIRTAASGEALFTAAEAVALLRQAAQYQAQIRTTQRAFEDLTPRELDVLRALVEGLDNQGIADRLFLSMTTVRTHVGEILRKLDVDSRLQAALFAVRNGITQQESD